MKTSNYRKKKRGEKDKTHSRFSSLDTPEDMAWLREVHLPNLPLKFRSAMVYGNEDYPDEIVVYESRDPNLDDPYTQYVLKRGK